MEICLVGTTIKLYNHVRNASIIILISYIFPSFIINAIEQQKVYTFLYLLIKKLAFIQIMRYIHNHRQYGVFLISSNHFQALA